VSSTSFLTIIKQNLYRYVPYNTENKLQQSVLSNNKCKLRNWYKYRYCPTI